RLALSNEAMEPVQLELGVEVGSDFADIFAVKEHDFALGHPMHAPPLPPLADPRWDKEHNQFVLVDRADGEVSRTQVIFSRRGSAAGGAITFPVRLDPRETWELHVDVVPSADGEQVAPHWAEQRFGEEQIRVRDSLAAWKLRVPQIRASWDELAFSFEQS